MPTSDDTFVLNLSSSTDGGSSATFNGQALTPGQTVITANGQITTTSLDGGNGIQVVADFSSAGAAVGGSEVAAAPSVSGFSFVDTQSSLGVPVSFSSHQATLVG